MERRLQRYITIHSKPTPGLGVNERESSRGPAQLNSVLIRFDLLKRRVAMNKIKKVIILFLLILLSSSLSYAGDQEKAVLKSLEKIKGTLETGGTDKEFDSLFTDANVEINILKRTCKNECFLKAVENCYSS